MTGCGCRRSQGCRCGSSASWCGSWRLGVASRPVRAAGGPDAGGSGVADRGVLPHQSDVAAGGVAVRGVEVGGAPDRGPPGAAAGAGAGHQAARARHRTHRGRDAGASARPERVGLLQELPVLGEPAGRHRRRHPPDHRSRLARSRQPQATAPPTPTPASTRRAGEHTSWPTAATRATRR